MLLHEQRQMRIADAIFNEFDRLGVSANQDLCSGLKTDVPNCFDYHNPDMILINVYNDSADGIYDAEALLEALKQVQTGEIGLDGDADNNVWYYLHDYQV